MNADHINYRISFVETQHIKLKIFLDHRYYYNLVFQEMTFIFFYDSNFLSIHQRQQKIKLRGSCNPKRLCLNSMVYYPNSFCCLHYWRWRHGQVLFVELKKAKSRLVSAFAVFFSSSSFKRETTTPMFFLPCGLACIPEITRTVRVRTVQYSTVITRLGKTAYGPELPLCQFFFLLLRSKRLPVTSVCTTCKLRHHSSQKLYANDVTPIPCTAIRHNFQHTIRFSPYFFAESIHNLLH